MYSCLSSALKKIFFAVFQVDLEPNGKLHVIIELDGTASEGTVTKVLMTLTDRYFTKYFTHAFMHVAVIVLDNVQVC